MNENEESAAMVYKKNLEKQVLEMSEKINILKYGSDRFYDIIESLRAAMIRKQNAIMEAENLVSRLYEKENDREIRACYAEILEVLKDGAENNF